MLIQLLTKQLWDGFQTVVLSPKIKLRILYLSHICLNFLIHLLFFPLKIFTLSIQEQERDFFFSSEIEEETSALETHIGSDYWVKNQA